MKRRTITFQVDQLFWLRLRRARHKLLKSLSEYIREALEERMERERREKE